MDSLLSVLICLMACCVASFSSLIPDMQLQESKIYCIPPTSEFILNGSRWLINGQYRRTPSNYIRVTELNHTDTVQCQLEDDEAVLTGWSYPFQIYNNFRPVLARLDPQRIFALSHDSAVTFGCGIQIEDEYKRDIEVVRLLYSSSCSSNGDIQFWKFLAASPINLTGVLKDEPRAKLFVQNLSVKLNLTAHEVQNQRLSVKCGIRFFGGRSSIHTCTEIIIKDMAPTTVPQPSLTPTSPRCPTTEDRQFVFHLNFFERCSDYRMGEALRFLLKQDACLNDGDFELQVSCENETSGLLVVQSPLAVATEKLSYLLSDVAQVVKTSDMLSTEATFTSASTSGSMTALTSAGIPELMTACGPVDALIGMCTALGVLLFLSASANIAGLVWMRRQKICPSSDNPPSPPEDPHDPSPPECISRQVSEESNTHNSVIVAPGQTPTITTHVEPFEVTHDSSAESTAQVSPHPLNHTELVRRRPYHTSSSSRDFDHSTLEQVASSRLPSQPQSFCCGATPGASAGVCGEPLSIPGAVDDSLSMPGDQVEHHQEQSVDRHRQAAVHLNTTQAGPTTPGNHKYVGNKFHTHSPWLDKNSTIAYHGLPYPAYQQQHAFPTVIVAPNPSCQSELPPGAMPLYTLPALPLYQHFMPQEPQVVMNDNSGE